jgi:hypothetical protein
MSRTEYIILFNKRLTGCEFWHVCPSIPVTSVYYSEYTHKEVELPISRENYILLTYGSLSNAGVAFT